jgi:YbgC/YbaW family acyl-CoA thioester hydrolase
MKDDLVDDPGAVSDAANAAGHCAGIGVVPTSAAQCHSAVTHTAHLRVAWVDTDASGRIHFTAVFRWAELAEHALLRALGVSLVEGFPRRHAEATYHNVLGFDDIFELVLTVEKVGRTSIIYSWKAFRGDSLCIEGRHVVVCVDEHEKPQPIPQELRSKLSGRYSP